MTSFRKKVWLCIFWVYFGFFFDPKAVNFLLLISHKFCILNTEEQIIDSLSQSFQHWKCHADPEPTAKVTTTIPQVVQTHQAEVHTIVSLESLFADDISCRWHQVLLLPNLILRFRSAFQTPTITEVTITAMTMVPLTTIVVQEVLHTPLPLARAALLQAISNHCSMNLKLVHRVHSHMWFRSSSMTVPGDTWPTT